MPSTAAGTITELLFNENEVVPIGAVIARIDTNSKEVNPAPAAQQQPLAPDEEEELAEAVPYVPHPTPVLTKPSAAGNRFYSPLVLILPTMKVLACTELEKIPGTGNDNRVTKKDILLM